MDLPSHVRVISLTTTNFKRIRAAQVVPDPAASVVLIGGEIDNGKSSLLDSMLDAFGGSKASPEVPVRKGMAKSETVIDLGPLLCRVRHTRAGGRELQIEDKEGNRLKKPQEIMDALTGLVGFDAEDFIRRKPTEQLEILRKIVGIDFAPLEAKKATLYTQRTAANSVVKTLETQLAAAVNPTDAPAELVDTTAVLAEIQKAQEHNKGRDQWGDSLRVKKNILTFAERDLLTAVSAHDTQEMHIADLEAKLKAAKEALPVKLAAVETARKDKEAAEKGVAHDQEKIETFPLQDVAPLQAKLAGADAANNKHRQAAARKKLAEDLKLAQTKATNLDTAIQEIDAEKEKLLTEAKFPVKGLSFGETGILFDGIPFDQAASSTKRRVSVAIGAALNPKLQVCVIKDGALLGQKGIEQVRELAAEFGLQVWIEVVTNSKEDEERCTVVIEDGMVKGAPAPVEENADSAEKSSTTQAPEPPKDLFNSLPNQ